MIICGMLCECNYFFTWESEIMQDQAEFKCIIRIFVNGFLIIFCFYLLTRYLIIKLIYQYIYYQW